MTDSPLVSAIITTKNEEKNIGRLLESIKKQTYKNIEIIVVDNNSTDKTLRIAKRFTDKVFNRGPERSVQRNFGAQKASGKYLMILDADMKLTPRVVEDCVATIKNSRHKALIIPEKTVGRGFLARLRNVEREMYMGDITIEVARFFDKSVFNEFSGYDPQLTGPEDYDLPARISKKYSIGWARRYIYHYEEELTLWELLRKKHYYATKSVAYADKHTEMVVKQGTIIFRRAYLKQWKKFLLNPILGISFLFVRSLVTVAAVSGYIKAAGLPKFIKTFFRMFRTSNRL